MDCPTLIAECLYRLGIRDIFGLVGVPITPVAIELEKKGVHFYGHRCETSAGYAAAVYGYLTHGERKGPGVLLSTGGPGFINALAGLSHASVNRMPLVVLAGSAALNTRGKGTFQELDQVTVCQSSKSFCKAVFQCKAISDIIPILCSAFTIAISGIPGAVYVDFPRDTLESKANEDAVIQWLKRIQSPVYNTQEQLAVTSMPSNGWDLLQKAILEANAPLIVAGEAISMEYGEQLIQKISATLRIPVLPTSMGRGVVDDTDPLCVSAVRSRVLREADLVLVIGTRINWMLHFGEPPRWNPSVKIILMDYEKNGLSSMNNIYVTITGGIKDILMKMEKVLCTTPLQLQNTANHWVQQVTEENKKRRLSISMVSTNYMVMSKPYMGFHQAMFFVNKYLDAWKKENLERRITLIAEGAQTMDVSRIAISVYNPRGRLDAGTWGTMGVGLPYCIASHAAGYTLPYITYIYFLDNSPNHLIVAVEGDSAIGFSLSELETIVRYNIPVFVFVFDNGGIYSGQNQDTERPGPTQLNQKTGYEGIMEAVGGIGRLARTAEDLDKCIKELININRPRLVHIIIDPEEYSTQLP